MAIETIKSAVTPPLQSSLHIKARETAQKFESFVLHQMLEFMSAGLKPDKNFGGGNGESLYHSLLNEHYANALSKQGGIGIADSVYREILRLQEQNS